MVAPDSLAPLEDLLSSYVVVFNQNHRCWDWVYLDLRNKSGYSGLMNAVLAGSGSSFI